MMSKLRRILSLLTMWLLVSQTVYAQHNVAKFGTPAYWLAESVIDVNAGWYTIACIDLEHAVEEAANVGDTRMQTTALMALGELKAKLGEWEEAFRFYTDALRIAVDTKYDFAQVAALSDMMVMCRSIGDVEGYNRYMTTMDSLCKFHISVSAQFVYHHYWVNDFMARGEFHMAELHLQNLRDLIPQFPHMEREISQQYYLHQAQALETAQRHFPEAIKYAKEYVKQTGKMYGKHSDEFYRAHGDLVSLYTFAGDSANAFLYLRSVEKGIGHDCRNEEVVAVFYNTVGLCYGNFRHYEKAVEWFDKAYNIMARKKPEFSPAKFFSLQYKAEAYLRLRELDECLNSFNEFTKACAYKFGKKSAQYHQAMGILAQIEGERGNVNEADSLFRVALDFTLDHMRHLWQYSTPTQREKFLMQTFGSIGEIAQFATKYGIQSGELARICYNALLFSKSLLLESERTLAQVIRSEGVSEDIENYNRLLALNNRLLTLNANAGFNRQEIDSLVIHQRDLERKLGSANSNYKMYEKYINLKYEDVKEILRKNETLIDFTSYMSVDTIREYAAFIFSNDSQYPILKKCFTLQQLDSLLNGMQSFTLYDYEQLQDKAADLIWKPIEASVPEGSTVYYVPSGILHAIALEALPLSDGTTLGQHYHFVRLTSARELLREKSAKANRKTAVLYGGLKYDVPAAKMAEESHGYDKSDLSWVMRSAYGSKGFKELGYTKGEVEKIEQTLTGMGYTVTPYIGTKGNAESFVAMSGKSPSILHIATHGFYYTPEEAKGYEYFEGNTDAMSLSGLVFAGGNTAWLGKEKADGVLGGILIANDIANLDFRVTDMVVLSACKTAQGMVTAEGVWGLQRAFKKAGVGTIVMSLWNVDDKVTSEFMTTFYERLADTANAADKRKAFEQAREIIRKKHPDPFHWAAFVMLD